MSSSVIPINQLSPGSDLRSYIHSVNAFPILTADEEQKLAHRFYDDGDLEAARELILSHLRFVVHIARTYRGYGLADADLIQEGNIGLMKAVKRFDPNVGVRLVSFAVHWIRAEIHEFIIKNWRIVKIATTKAQRKLFFKLRDAKKGHTGWLTRKETEAIAEDFGVRAEDVSQMEGRMSSPDVNFDTSVSDDDETASWSPAQTFVDETPIAEVVLEKEDWDSQQHERLYNAIQTLDERSRVVLMERWLSEPKATLQELASKFGVSAERIRQLESAAMEKIRGHLLVA
ncbi:MAG: RNA polymerase sigma factor RpoH [Gammaproteobacteria bacterium]|nr:RNA polymerase sigma factor RpoH [Gammaproteobacteria bacterium]